MPSDIYNVETPLNPVYVCLWIYFWLMYELIEWAPLSATKFHQTVHIGLGPELLMMTEVGPIPSKVGSPRKQSSNKQATSWPASASQTCSLLTLHEKEETARCGSHPKNQSAIRVAHLPQCLSLPGLKIGHTGSHHRTDSLTRLCSFTPLSLFPLSLSPPLPLQCFCTGG